MEQEHQTWSRGRLRQRAIPKGRDRLRAEVFRTNIWNPPNFQGNPNTLISKVCHVSILHASPQESKDHARQARFPEKGVPSLAPEMYGAQVLVFSGHQQGWASTKQKRYQMLHYSRLWGAGLAPARTHGMPRPGRLRWFCNIQAIASDSGFALQGV